MICRQLNLQMEVKLGINNGKYHRDNDLPAIEYADGSKEWYQHGNLHRENDLPAIERSDGSKERYKNGKRYR